MRDVATTYRMADVVTRTGLSASTVLWLEHLGVFPSSACHHDLGRFWIAAEVDDWARFLKQPSVRDWVETLLPPTSRANAGGDASSSNSSPTC